jgi:putative ABC transport system substrate-binding protein
MIRREFITLLAGAAAWPLAAHAQQGDRVRRIGWLGATDENFAKTVVSAFTQALAGLGWTDGRNVRIDFRWGGADINRIRALAQELVGLQVRHNRFAAWTFAILPDICRTANHR